MRLKDRVALVTGAGRGIGKATAILFAAEGAHLAAADVDFEEASSTARAIQADGGSALPVKVDVSDRSSVDRAVQEILERYGRIDVLVNNAGILRDAQLTKMSAQDFQAVIDVNLTGVFHCTQAIVPHLIEQGRGVILNASSVVGRFGNFGQTNYVASKAGVIGMTLVWARELGRKGIRVNAVAPGFIETAMTRGIPEKVQERILERIPLGRMGTPEEVARAYLWLASDDAVYITGQVLGVDGGATV